MCAHLMLFTAICRPNFSVLEDTGAWDMFGFLIPILGNMMRMPGLPAIPASEGMDIDNNGVITGLS